MDCFAYRTKPVKTGPQQDFATLIQVHEKSSAGSVADYQKYLESKFEEIDSNHDGNITVDEMEAYLS